jgi:S-adenosylmethionine:tRNA ribosyltransferase-isomerase
MRVDAFQYELPPDRVAQRPLPDREASRLLVIDRAGALIHRAVADLAEFIPDGALVVLNDTRVIPARLLGVKADTGGRVEIFLVRRVGSRVVTLDGIARELGVWRALGKSSKALRFPSDIACGPLRVHLLGRAEDDGLLEVALVPPAGIAEDDAIREVGHVPLPPYIKRDDELDDRERYQTVYARNTGAVAAPTAGLHITRALLGRLAVRGCDVASVTLHVGLGTFQPVTVTDLNEHPMHAEHFEITRATASAIARAKDAGRPVVAVGTTTVRALESAADPAMPGHVRPCAEETRLLIQPGYTFRVVDMLFTNFHLPRSTLLAMVCAFGGTPRVLRAYEAAVREGYRFFSYGDAMLVPREAAS